MADVHVRAWQVGYRGLLPDDYLDGLRPEHRAVRYAFGHRSLDRPRTLVALDGGSIRGFVTTAPCRDDDLPGFGEVCALYVDPDHWRTGIGSLLLGAARSRLVRHGFQGERPGTDTRDVVPSSGPVRT